MTTVTAAPSNAAGMPRGTGSEVATSGEWTQGPTSFAGRDGVHGPLGSYPGYVWRWVGMQQVRKCMVRGIPACFTPNNSFTPGGAHSEGEHPHNTKPAGKARLRHLFAHILRSLLSERR